MRLDMDCVRSILLCVEENTGVRRNCHFVDTGLPDVDAFLGHETVVPSYQAMLEKEYDNEKIIYHARYCIDAGLLCENSLSNGTDIWISDLTPKGHELLSNIRDSGNWSKTKEVGSKVGAFGLNMASKIAEGVVTALIKTELGIL